MFEVAGLVIFFVAGYAAWKVVATIFCVCKERVAQSVQDRILKTLKALPRTLLDIFLVFIFLSSVGAVLLQLALRPLGLATLLPAARWAPIVLALLAWGVICHFFDSAGDTNDPPQSRGRDVGKSHDDPIRKQSNPHAQEKRGRVIRSYRDLN